MRVRRGESKLAHEARSAACGRRKRRRYVGRRRPPGPSSIASRSRPGMSRSRAPFRRCVVLGVQHHVLGRVQARGRDPRARASGRSGRGPWRAPDLVVEPRHLRVRRVGDEVRGEPVHADAGLVEVVEDSVQCVDRDAEAGLRLPAPRVVAPEALAAEDLDGEADAASRLRHVRLGVQRSCRAWTGRAFGGRIH